MNNKRLSVFLTQLYTRHYKSSEFSYYDDFHTNLGTLRLTVHILHVIKSF